jgi:TIR domain-containing protein
MKGNQRRIAHDVYISHAHKDRSIADAICERLESTRVRCWLAERDISAGEDWTEATRNAIGSSRVMVLVLSENTNAAPHIEREIAHAFYTKRIIIPFRLTNTPPRRDFLFYLSNVRWFDACSPPAEQHLEALTASINDMVRSRSIIREVMPPQDAIEITTPLRYSTSGIDPRRDPDNQTLGILKCVAIAASLIAVAWLFVPWLTKRGLSPTGGSVRSVNSSADTSRDSLASAVADASVSKPVDAWMAPSPRPPPSAQQGSQEDESSRAPVAEPENEPPASRSDVDQKVPGEADSVQPRNGTGADSVQASPVQKINQQADHRGRSRPKSHKRRAGGSEGSRFADIKGRLRTFWHRIVAGIKETGSR